MGRVLYTTGSHPTVPLRITSLPKDVAWAENALHESKGMDNTRLFSGQGCAVALPYEAKVKDAFWLWTILSFVRGRSGS